MVTSPCHSELPLPQMLSAIPPKPNVLLVWGDGQQGCSTAKRRNQTERNENGTVVMPGRLAPEGQEDPGLERPGKAAGQGAPRGCLGRERCFGSAGEGVWWN